jgi:hypothetical protein
MTDILSDNSALFQFVQVESDAVYIDSRVYCREVIEVDHGNWLSDTLKKYQETIEHEFGAIRYETDELKHSQYKGSAHQRYALLTEAQCNACLVLSKNLVKTIPAKMQLVADFERAKTAVKAQLESQLVRSENTKLVEDNLAKIAELTELLKDWEAKYKQVYDRMQYHQARAMGNDMLVRLKDKPEAFSEDSELLWLISGIASKSYFVGRCRDDLEYGVDYVNGARKGTIKLTPYATLQMLLNFRSKKGVQARYLPETVEVTVKKSIGSDGSKINRRKMQQS